MPPIDGSFFFVLFILIVLALVAVGLLRLIDGPKGPSRLLTPRIDEVEIALGYRLPQATYELYADQDLIQEEFFELVDHTHNPPRRWDIAGFLPADLKELKWTTRISKIEGFAFASNAYGEYYYLRKPSGDAPEQSVYLRPFEGEDVLVADSLEKFLSFEKDNGDEEDE